jgi:hypothetical protein
MDTIRDIAHGEKVEGELNILIERRHDKRCTEEGERPAEEMWAESVARFHERSEAEMRERWHEYHCHMATLHGRLADEHQAKAEELENGHRGEGAIADA